MDREYKVVIYGCKRTKYTYWVKAENEIDALTKAKCYYKSGFNPESEEVGSFIYGGEITEVTKATDGKSLVQEDGFHRKEMEFIDEAIARATDEGLPYLAWPEDLDLDLGFTTTQYIPSLNCRVDINIYFRCCCMERAQAYIYYADTQDFVIPEDREIEMFKDALDYINVPLSEAEKWGWKSIDSDTIISYLSDYDAIEEVEKAVELLRNGAKDEN